jgi:hypothetical protein
VVPLPDAPPEALAAAPLDAPAGFVFTPPAPPAPPPTEGPSSPASGALAESRHAPPAVVTSARIARVTPRDELRDADIVPLRPWVIPQI